MEASSAIPARIGAALLQQQIYRRGVDPPAGSAYLYFRKSLRVCPQASSNAPACMGISGGSPVWARQGCGAANSRWQGGVRGGLMTSTCLVSCLVPDLGRGSNTTLFHGRSFLFCPKRTSPACRCGSHDDRIRGACSHSIETSVGEPGNTSMDMCVLTDVSCAFNSSRTATMQQCISNAGAKSVEGMLNSRA